MEAVVMLSWIGMLVASLMNNAAPQTTVVLVDNHKNHNAIVVQTKAGSVVVDKANYFVNITSKEKKPSSAKKMSKKQINTIFKSAIKALPPEPEHVYLYFKKGTSELTLESNNKLPHIYKLIQQRSPCDISIIGHTDTKGSQESNQKLSLKRAKSIKSWLLSREPDISNLKVQGYGENDLLVPTPDEVSEPRNRTVEIFIK